MAKQTFGYQPNNPLTRYAERVQGINSKDPNSTKRRNKKLHKKKYRAK